MEDDDIPLTASRFRSPIGEPSGPKTGSTPSVLPAPTVVPPPAPAGIVVVDGGSATDGWLGAIAHASVSVPLRELRLPAAIAASASGTPSHLAVVALSRLLVTAAGPLPAGRVAETLGTLHGLWRAVKPDAASADSDGSGRYAAVSAELANALHAWLRAVLAGAGFEVASDPPAADGASSGAMTTPGPTGATSASRPASVGVGAGVAGRLAPDPAAAADAVDSDNECCGCLSGRSARVAPADRAAAADRVARRRASNGGGGGVRRGTSQQPLRASTADGADATAANPVVVTVAPATPTAVAVAAASPQPPATTATATAVTPAALREPTTWPAAPAVKLPVSLLPLPVAAAAAAGAGAVAPAQALACGGIANGSFIDALLMVLRGCGTLLDDVLATPAIEAAVQAGVEALDSGDVKRPLERLARRLRGAEGGSPVPDCLTEGSCLSEVCAFTQADFEATLALVADDPTILAVQAARVAAASSSPSPPAGSAPAPVAPASPNLATLTGTLGGAAGLSTLSRSMQLSHGHDSSGDRGSDAVAVVVASAQLSAGTSSSGGTSTGAPSSTSPAAHRTPRAVKRPGALHEPDSAQLAATHSVRLLLAAVEAARAVAAVATVLDRSLVVPRRFTCPEVAALARYVHLPLQFSSAGRAHRFSALFARLLSGCWSGDAVAVPPAGGLPAPFLVGLLYALALPLAASPGAGGAGGGGRLLARPGSTTNVLLTRGASYQTMMGVLAASGTAAALRGASHSDVAPASRHARRYTTPHLTLDQLVWLLDVPARSLLLHGELCTALTRARQLAAPGGKRDHDPLLLLDVSAPVQQRLRVTVTRNAMLPDIIRLVHHQAPTAGDRLALPPSPVALLAAAGSVPTSQTAPFASAGGFRVTAGGTSALSPATLDTLPTLPSIAHFTDAGTVRIIHPYFRRPQTATQRDGAGGSRSPSPFGGAGGSDSLSMRSGGTSTRGATRAPSPSTVAGDGPAATELGSRPPSQLSGANAALASLGIASRRSPAAVPRRPLAAPTATLVSPSMQLGGRGGMTGRTDGSGGASDIGGASASAGAGDGESGRGTGAGAVAGGRSAAAAPPLTARIDGDGPAGSRGDTWPPQPPAAAGAFGSADDTIAQALTGSSGGLGSSGAVDATSTMLADDEVGSRASPSRPPPSAPSSPPMHSRPPSPATLAAAASQLGAGADDGGGAVEEGEGHGPRKEVFLALAAEATARWRPYVTLPGSVVGDPDPAKRNSLIVTPAGKLPHSLTSAVAHGSAASVESQTPALGQRRLSADAAELALFAKRLVDSKVRIRGSGTATLAALPPHEAVVSRAKLSSTGLLHLELEAPLPTAWLSALHTAAVPASASARRMVVRSSSGAVIQLAVSMLQRPLFELRPAEGVHWPSAAVTLSRAAGAPHHPVGAGAGAAHAGLSLLSADASREVVLGDKLDGWRYQALGWMAAAALVNRCALPLHLPPAVWSQIVVDNDAGAATMRPAAPVNGLRPAASFTSTLLWGGGGAATATTTTTTAPAGGGMRTTSAGAGAGAPPASPSQQSRGGASWLDTVVAAGRAHYIPSMADLQGCAAATAAAVAAAYDASPAEFAALLASDGMVAQRDPSGRVRLVDSDAVHLSAGWVVLPPTSMAARHAYAAHTLTETLVEGMRPHVRALRAGYRSALGGGGIAHVVGTCGVTAAELGELTAQAAGPARPLGGGGEDGDDATAAGVDLRRYFRVVYDDEARECGPLRRALWAVVNGWTASRQRALLRFLTGVDALPSPGVEALHIETPFTAYGAAQQRRILAMLPQAHSCTNTLELPNYWAAMKVTTTGDGGSDGATEGEGENEDSATPPSLLLQRCIDVIEEKLGKAVDLSDGYGLDDRGAATAGASKGGGIAVSRPAVQAAGGGGGGIASSSGAAGAPADSESTTVVVTVNESGGGAGTAAAVATAGAVGTAASRAGGRHGGGGGAALALVRPVMGATVDAAASPLTTDSDALLPGQIGGAGVAAVPVAAGGGRGHAREESWDPNGELGNLLDEVADVLGGAQLSPTVTLAATGGPRAAAEGF